MDIHSKENNPTVATVTFEEKSQHSPQAVLRNEPTQVHIEICMKKHSPVQDKQIKKLFINYSQRFHRYYIGKMQYLPQPISRHVIYVRICMKVSSVPIHDCDCHFYVFRNDDEGIIEEIDDRTNESDPAHVANTYMMPNHEFDGLFESLIFEEDIKNRLLNYMKTISFYGKAGIDKNVIGWNGVILLHGPPGTGKTSLCKALAQKLSIRCAHEFPHCNMIEINAHSLFSKWFSESGKMIEQLFKHIKQLVEDRDSLVFVLIDEVESLAAARQSALNGSEPSDSIRVVNCLLTQLDGLRSFPNVVVLATSNISQSIDLAFIDRADLKQFIGNPNAKARYLILESSIKELIRKKLLYFASGKGDEVDDWLSQKLMPIVQSLDGFSGRSLRKLPFITSVRCVDTDTCSVMHFIECLRRTVAIEKYERLKLN
eukprot:251779_1